MTRTTTVEPPGCPAQLRAICCDALGYVKVVEPRGENGAEKAPLDVVARWGQPGSGISAMSYSNYCNRLAVGRKSGAIEILDSADGSICAQLASLNIEGIGEKNREENDTICGLHLFKEAQTLLRCTSSGDAVLQSLDVQERSSTDVGVLYRWNVRSSGNNVLSMSVHDNEKFASFGGDRVELSLWDLESSSKVWEAKKPRANNIGLVSLPYVTASTFLLKDDHRKVVIGTGDYQVRLYDILAQKRPVIAVTFKESPVKAVAEDPDGFTVYVGNSTGSMASFDMRTGRLLAGFKGKLAGSVRSIARHPSLPLIASCGLDRFLRIHDIGSRQLLGRIFLKQQLVAVAFDDKTLSKASIEPLLSESKEQPKGKRKNEAEDQQESAKDEENKKRKKSKKLAKKLAKRKQEDEDGASPIAQLDESPKKKRKELKKLKRKQQCEQDEIELNGKDDTPKKKKKKGSKQKTNTQSTRKRTREE